MKGLTYVFTAILLVGSAKLVEIIFYEQLKSPHPEDKEYHGESDGEKSYEKDPPNYNDVPAKKKEDTVGIVEEEPAFDSNDSETSTGTSKNTFETRENDSDPNESVAQSQNTKPSSTESSELSGEAYFRDLRNSYLNPILATLPEGRAREDVVIRYYKHNKDEDKVYTLRKLGYYLHQREAEDNKNLASNVIYYGSEVDVRDIKMVAYTLIQNNVGIKSIEQSQYDWKINAMEIGADSLLNNRSVLSLADIQSFAK